MFKSVTLQNFQSFQGNHEAELNQINLVFGPNASGKSALIRSLRALGESYSNGGFVSSGFGHGFNLRSAEAAIFGQLRDDKAPRRISYGFTIASPSRFSGILSLGSSVSKIFGVSDESDFYEVNLTIQVTEEVRNAAEEFLERPVRRNEITLILRLKERGGKLENQEFFIENYDEEIESVLESLFLANGTWGELPGGYPHPTKEVTQFDDRHKEWHSDWEHLLGELLPRLRISGPQFTLGVSNVEDWDEANWINWVNGDVVSSVNRAGLIAAILEHFLNEAEHIFANLRHIPSIRAVPEKLSSSRGYRFEDQVEVSEEISKALLDLTEGRYSDVSKKIKVPETGELYYSNLLHDHMTKVDVTFDEVGAGISQIYPALVSLFDDSKVVFIEQPELHLHPKMQAKFMDLVIQAATARSDKQFILETHSESLLLRLQKRIREGKFDKARSRVLFIDQVRDTDSGMLPGDIGRRPSEITTIKIDQIGDLIDPLPVSFVDLRLTDLL